MARPSGVKPVARCLECRRKVTVRADGGLHTHATRPRGGEYPCPGSGQPVRLDLDAGVIELIETSLTEWAVQCRTRDGGLHTGNPKTSRKEAERSGERLANINGADWWLVSRHRAVTVETSPWTPTTTADPERAALAEGSDT